MACATRLERLTQAGRAPDRTAGYALAALSLHAAALAILAFPANGAGGFEAPPFEAPPFEVQFTDQMAQTKGGGESAMPTPPVPPAPAGAAASPAPPPPAGARSELRPKAVGAPSRADAPSNRDEFAAVNLGSGDETLDRLKVTGDIVVPPRPDARFRNLPPAYPPAATARGAQGDVFLVIHVGASGAPEWVELRSGSGDAALDEAARAAASRWRFEPARNEGLPVPFQYPIQFRFRLGGTP